MSLGKKYACYKCSTRFYDLGREVPLCPKCGVDQRTNPEPDPREALLARYKRGGGESTKGRRPKPGGEEEEEFEEDVAEDASFTFDEDLEEINEEEDEPEEYEEEEADD